MQHESGKPIRFRALFRQSYKGDKMDKTTEQAIIADFLSGMTCESIRKKYHIGSQTVTKVKRRNGITNEKVLKGRNKDRNEAIIELRKQGLTMEAIAERLDICEGVVREQIRCYPGNDVQKEQLTTALPSDVLRDKYCPAGFEWIDYRGGYNPVVTLRCKECGYEFTKNLSSFRGINANNKTHCRECDKRKQQEKREKLKKERELKAIQKKQEREASITGTQLFFNVCPVCNETFIGKRKYCSSECGEKAAKSTYRHKRRARMKAQIIDHDITLEGVARRDNNVCWLCGEPVDWNDCINKNGLFIAGRRYPTRDHVFPLSKGGLHSWDNVKLAHNECNRNKGTEIV